MDAPINDILADDRAETQFARADRTLHIIARKNEALAAESPHHGEVLSGPLPVIRARIGKHREPATVLIHCACLMVDPECVAHLSSKKGMLSIAFDPKYQQKPPIWQIRAKLAELKTQIESCFTEYDGHYYVENKVPPPFNVVKFVDMFAKDGHRPMCNYDLPPGVTFIDAGGVSHAGRVRFGVMKSYLASNEYPGLAGNDIDNLTPTACIIDSWLMKRIVKELEMGIQKGGKAS